LLNLFKCNILKLYLTKIFLLMPFIIYYYSYYYLFSTTCTASSSSKNYIYRCNFFQCTENRSQMWILFNHINHNLKVARIFSACCEERCWLRRMRPIGVGQFSKLSHGLQLNRASSTLPPFAPSLSPHRSSSSSVSFSFFSCAKSHASLFLPLVALLLSLCLSLSLYQQVFFRWKDSVA